MKASDFEKLEVITVELMLGDKRNSDGTLAKVKVYRETKTGKAFQVDYRNGEYREASHVLGNYGSWKKLAG